MPKIWTRAQYSSLFRHEYVHTPISDDFPPNRPNGIPLFSSLGPFDPTFKRSQPGLRRAVLGIYANGHNHCHHRILGSGFASTIVLASQLRGDSILLLSISPQILQYIANLKFIGTTSSIPRKNPSIMRAGQAVATHNFLTLDVVRVRSTDSQEPVIRSIKNSSLNASSPIPIRATPDRQQEAWRTKDQASIFRSSPGSSPPQMADMLSIRRCLAFDEDDE